MGAISPGVKHFGCKADHSPLSSAKVKIGGAVPPFAHISSWYSAQLIKHRENFLKMDMRMVFKRTFGWSSFPSLA
jgi:hypothetical protein